MRLQLKNNENKFSPLLEFEPLHCPLEPKAGVLSMSYNDPIIVLFFEKQVKIFSKQKLVCPFCFSNNYRILPTVILNRRILKAPPANPRT